MAKVGRAATVGSKQRVETITADKTITKHETGELYLIDHDASSTITITLPPLRAGAYFKFLVDTDMNDNGAAVAIASANGAGTIRGLISGMEQDGGTHGFEVDAGSATTVTIGPGVGAEIVGMHHGSYVEVVSDGDQWLVEGCVYVSSGATSAMGFIDWDA
jgi:hypothetical protein